VLTPLNSDKIHRLFSYLAFQIERSLKICEDKGLEVDAAQVEM
jgi:hypothetical protein